MVAQEEQPYMTVEGWRSLLRSSPDARYEYIDGYIYLMSGGSLDHSDIATNALVALRLALGDDCWVRNSDAATRLSPSRYTFPDVSISCDPGDKGKITEVQQPRVIFEILSEGTEAYDRGQKFGYYRACPSVQEYVLVGTLYQLVEVYRRTAAGWILQEYRPGDTIYFSSIEATIAVKALYHRTDVPASPPKPQGRV